MIDLESVIGAIEHCTNDDETGELSAGCCGCPYNGRMSCAHRAQRDALELLKKQRPKAVSITWQNKECKDGDCPSCGYPLSNSLFENYCGRCGQAVKWE